MSSPSEIVLTPKDYNSEIGADNRHTHRLRTTFFFKGHHSGRASGTDQRKGLVAVQSPESKRHRVYPLHTDTHSKTCCQGYSSHTCSEFHELLKMTELNTHHHNPIIRFFPALEGIKHGGGDRPHIISVYE